MDLRVNSCIPQNRAFKGGINPPVIRTFGKYLSETDKTILKAQIGRDSISTEGLSDMGTAFAQIVNFMKKLHNNIDLSIGYPAKSLFKLVFNDRKGHAVALPMSEFIDRGDRGEKETIKYLAEQISSGNITEDMVHSKVLGKLMEHHAFDRLHPDLCRTEEEANIVAKSFADDTGMTDIYEQSKAHGASQAEFERLYNILSKEVLGKEYPKD